MKKKYNINGILIFGFKGESLLFKNRKIKATSIKQAKFLLSKELSEKELKFLNQKQVYNLVKKSNLKFTLIN